MNTAKHMIEVFTLFFRTGKNESVRIQIEKAMIAYAKDAIDKCAEQTVDKQIRQDILNVKSLLK